MDDAEVVALVRSEVQKRSAARDVTMLTRLVEEAIRAILHAAVEFPPDERCELGDAFAAAVNHVIAEAK